MKKRVLSLLLAVMMVFTVLPAASFAASASDFTIENGVLTKYNGTGENVVIPDSVTSIGDYAFYDCSSLTSVTIPNSVISIGEYAFSWCGSLTSVTIPDSVTSIGYDAFYYCSSLTSVTIPDSVTSIEYGAFYGCESLTSVTIPNSVIEIGGAAFYGTPWLEAQGDFVIVNGILIRYQGNSAVVTIPNSVTSIGDYAFDYCSSLTSVTIPDSVTSIGVEAFYYCSSLTSVTIGNSVTSIGDGAFYVCSSLTSVTIPDSVTSIGDYAFYSCSSLTSVTIPDSVTSIGESAFYECSSLTSVTIPNSVTSIGCKAFDETPWLKAQGDFAIVNGILIRYQGNSDVATIPNSVTSIGDEAFSWCSSLTSVTIPDSVTSIGERAFYVCSSLTSVTMPDSVTSIGERVFLGCISLTDVYYGGSKEQWNRIDGNSNLSSTIIRYNSTTPTVPTTATAIPTGNTLLVDGAEKLPAAYLINDNNYFKLRDVAALLNGTKAQFSIGWDGVTGAITITTGEAYTALGTELQGAPTSAATAAASQSVIYINGQKADLTAYLINDNNYFKLRDLGKALGFNVSWDGIKGAVLIESDKPYSDAN